jgi:hypothetical protein
MITIWADIIIRCISINSKKIFLFGQNGSLELNLFNPFYQLTLKLVQKFLFKLNFQLIFLCFQLFELI